MVDADAQDLGIELLEPGHFGLVRGKLVRSDRCPGQGKERNHDGALSRHLLSVTFLSRWLGRVKLGAFFPTFNFMLDLLE